jgi:imidazole glycerol-phosphate synthase subunit HisH
MITVINYGMGNLNSVMNMLKKLNVATEITSDISVIAAATKIILPGVGAFGSAMEQIDQLGMRSILNEKALQQQIPILGICLGMQLLTRGSEESPTAAGLGWIAADTVKFQFSNAQIKVPHMGWSLTEMQGSSPLHEGFENDTRFYFAHSYYVQLDNHNKGIMTTEYGGTVFQSGVQDKNIVGVQFHPEKSHRFGMQVLQNFANWNP